MMVRALTSSTHPLLSRQGQFGTYVKPFMVLVFMVLLVFMVVQVLDFQVGLEETRSEVDFEQEIRRDMQQLVECLRVDDEYSGSSFVLNASELEEYEQSYQLREPECAENIQYGFNVTVQEQPITTREVETTPEGGPVDVVFAIDDSGSMGPHMQAVQENVRDFMEMMPAGSRAGMFTWSTPCRETEEYENWEPARDYPERDKSEDLGLGPTMGPEADGALMGSPTGLDLDLDIDIPDLPDIDTMMNCHIDFPRELREDPAHIEETLDGLDTAGGLEPVDGAVRWATEPENTVFDWRDDVRKLLIVIATEPATRDRWTRPAYYEEAGIAWDEFGVESHYVAEDEDCWGEAKDPDPDVDYCGDEWRKMAEAGNGNFYNIHEEDFEDILEDIGGDSSPAPPVEDTTCVAPTDFEAGTDPLDAAFVVDVTESMEDNMVSVRQNIDRFGDEISDSSRIGIVTYRDGVEDVHAFTGAAHELNEYLDTLEAVGGEEPPSGAAEGADAAMEQLDWDDDHRHKLFLINSDGAHNQDRDCSDKLTDIAADAGERDITVHTVTDMPGEDADPDRYGDIEEYNTAHCAGELAGTVPEDTGGENRELAEHWAPLLDRISQEDQQEGTVIGDEVICEPSYDFGAREGSDFEGVDQQLELRYPVTIWHERDIQVPAELVISVRDGGMERLFSAINAVARQGEEQGEVVERTLRFNTRQELYSDVRTVERPEETTYQLVNAETGSTSVNVENDIHIGVNGQPVVQVETGSPSTIDFSDPENQFTAHQGAGIQVIVQNLEGEADVDPLAVACVEGCDGRQDIEMIPAGEWDNGDTGDDTDDIETEEDEPDPREMFMYGVEQLDIGEMEHAEEPTVCAATTGDDSCAVVRPDTLSEFTLSPGSHLIGIEYDPGTSAATITE